MVSKGQVVGWALLFLSYVAFYLCRKNYAFWLQGMMAAYGLSAAELGLLGSVFEASFGAGNILGGFLLDRSDPTIVLAASLGLSAACNLALAATSSLPLLAAINLVHGAAQSLGWPALSQILLLLFPKDSERGRWYSFLSVSQNTGSALTPLLVTVSVTWMGWRGALVGPGIAALTVAAALFPGLRMTAGARSEHAVQPHPASKAKAADATASPSATDVFKIPALLLLGLAYMFISVVRVALANWLPVYLDTARSQASIAPLAIMAMEMGGFVGGLSCGAVSDAVFGGRRAPVMALCAMALAVCLFMFWAGVPAFPAWLPGIGAVAAALGQPLEALSVATWCLLLGATAFPIHVLLGLASRELVPVEISATAAGLVKAMGQVGSVMAGYALAKAVQVLGWSAVGTGLVASAAISGACLLPLWNQSAAAHKQKRA